MDRAAALTRFDQLLGKVFVDNTVDEAMVLWRYRVMRLPDEARTDLDALDAVLADPPDDLDERLADRGGIRLFHSTDAEITPYTDAERDDWLRALAARLRAAL